MIIKTLSFCNFIDEFKGTQYSDNFTYEGLRALYDYLDEMSDENGINYELDVVALCGEFCEYESLEAYNQEYTPVDSTEDICDYTTVIYIDGNKFIIQQY